MKTLRIFLIVFFLSIGLFFLWPKSRTLIDKADRGVIDAYENYDYSKLKKVKDLYELDRMQGAPELKNIISDLGQIRKADRLESGKLVPATLSC